MTKTTKPKFRTAYSPNVRVGFATIGESKTDPIFAEELKIQNMIKKYDSTNLLELVSNKTPQYVDLSDVTDLQSAMSKIQEAQETFMEVPATIRERFQNNPQSFYNFVNDKNNLDELVNMGLATKPNGEVPPVSSPVVEEKPAIPPDDTSEG